jgi:predicted amidohydrolase YtcJ
MLRPGRICLLLLLLMVSDGFAVAQSVPSEGLEPDLIVLHANVITVDESLRRAEAFAVRDGRFTAVGSSDAILRLKGAHTQIVDASGKTIVPGFNDSHLHAGPQYPEDHLLGSVGIGPDRVKTMEDLIAAMKSKAGLVPEGQWIHGGRYQDTKLGRHPNRHDLDQISEVHPIVIRHSSGHVSVFNTLALKLAGIDADTPDPAGGAFDREEDGFPNGVAREGAASMVRRGGPRFPEANASEEIQGMRNCLDRYLRNGITSIGDAGASPNKLKLYRDAQHPIRASIMISESQFDQLADLGIKPGWEDERLRVTTIKVFHGNSLSGRTCWLAEPYEVLNPETGLKDYFGIPPKRTQEELNALFARIHHAGYQIAVHSNGDREIPMVVEAMDQAMSQNPRSDPRHRIEHCSVINDAILQDIQRLGIVVVPHSYIYEHGDKMEEYGSWRWHRMHANRTFIEAGIPLPGTPTIP